MKRIMALTAAMSMMALFVLASHAHAQGEATASVDPEYVGAAGSHSITVSGSNWPDSGTVVIPCAGYGGAAPAEVVEAEVFASCDLTNLFPGTVSDGSLSASFTLDIPADGLVLLVGNQAAGLGVFVVVKVGEPMAEDMGDDMAPEGAAETGFGGMAGSDGNSIAVPLAATLAAVALLGGTALVARRHS